MLLAQVSVQQVRMLAVEELLVDMLGVDEPSLLSAQRLLLVPVAAATMRRVGEEEEEKKTKR